MVQMAQVQPAPPVAAAAALKLSWAAAPPTNVVHEAVGGLGASNSPRYTLIKTAQTGNLIMKTHFYNRRSFMRAATLAGAAATVGSIAAPLHAQTLTPTDTMRGGSNNYRPNAPLVDALGTGFLMSGLVRDVSTGVPLADVRIQIWAATTLGGEREPRNHGSVLTRADGTYSLEMPQIVPNFGQPHAHLAYDDAEFKTVFLRPVMPSAQDTSLNVNFNLQRT